MPEICRFFEIIIINRGGKKVTICVSEAKPQLADFHLFTAPVNRMYAKEHAPPHFHAMYGEFEALFSIAGGKILKGKFPAKQARLVKAWAAFIKKNC